MQYTLTQNIISVLYFSFCGQNTIASIVLITLSSINVCRLYATNMSFIMEKFKISLKK